LGKAAQNSAVSSTQINEKSLQRKEKTEHRVWLLFGRQKVDKDKPIENGLKVLQTFESSP